MATVVVVPCGLFAALKLCLLLRCSNPLEEAEVDDPDAADDVLDLKLDDQFTTPEGVSLVRFTGTCNSTAGFPLALGDDWFGQRVPIDPKLCV